MSNGSTAIDGGSAALRRWRLPPALGERRASLSRVPFPDPDRPVDVLDRDLAAVGEGDVDAVADALVDDRGDADAAGLGERLQPRGDVDAVAVDVVAVDDDVAEIDADAEHDLGWRALRPAHGLRALDGERAFDGVDDAAELDQRAVADQLDDTALVGGDRRIEDRLAVALQRGERAGLVGPHHAGIADHVGRENGRKPPVGAFFGHGRRSLIRRNPTQRNAPF